MVVVLPEPLTPTTRITCGRGKASISSGSATGARIFSSSSATISRTACLAEAALEPLAGEPRADLGRGRRAEVGGDQRLLDLVERRLVERGLGEQAGEIVAEPVRGLPEAERACARTRASRSRGLSDQASSSSIAGDHVTCERIVRRRRSRFRGMTTDRREILGMAAAVLSRPARCWRRPDQALQPRRLAPRRRPRAAAGRAALTDRRAAPAACAPRACPASARRGRCGP